MLSSGAKRAEGDWPRPLILPVNCDGEVNLLDVGPFAGMLAG